MTERLFTVQNVATILGRSRPWVSKHRKLHPALAPQFSATRQQGGGQLWLWTSAGLDCWRTYIANIEAKSASPYSCLNAVDRVGDHVVTWKLWWQNLPAGATKWWFSTPCGWYVSSDDGKCWEPAYTMVLDGAYKYFWVNPAVVERNSAVAAVLYSACRLRRHLEGEVA